MDTRSATNETREYLLAMIESLANFAFRSREEELAILLAALAAAARLRDCAT